VILADNFVLLEIPAFDLLVFAGREEVWMSVRDGERSHGVDMACKGNHELSFDQVPELDRPIV